VSRCHATRTASASADATSPSARLPWRVGLTSPTAPFTKSAGAWTACSSASEAAPITSPDRRRFRAPSIVPWIAKFQTSATGAPPARRTASTATSGSSGPASRLRTTGGAAATPTATRAGPRLSSARRTASTTAPSSASRTAASSRSAATKPMRAESTNAPGPECVCDAETIKAPGRAPARASRVATVSVNARSTATRSTVTHTTRVSSRSSTSARAASGSRSARPGLNQNACG